MIREVLQKFNEIRHLTLDLRTKEQKLVFNPFKDSVILQNLIELIVKGMGDQRCDLIINCLKQMSKKFRNLKKIKLLSEINFIVLENLSDFEQLMSSLKAFPHLKRLDISLKFMSGLEFEKSFSFKFFSQELTHLRIAFYEQKLNVFYLKDIDIYLPKLQCISFYTHYSRRRRSDTNCRYSEPTLKT